MATRVPKLRPSLRSHAPGLAYERALWEAGVETVVGLDEVGRGSWAGPLSVGAVVVPRDRRIYKIRDSKQLTPHERTLLMDRITGWAMAWSVGHASAHECDELGMSAAQRLATTRAIASLGLEPGHALVDGIWDFVDDLPATTIVKGDAISLSIAAASIVAKVTRDALMGGLSETYPWYSFEDNKGYPSPTHRSALSLVGPSTLHRRSWSYMLDLGWDGIPDCRREPKPLSLF